MGIKGGCLELQQLDKVKLYKVTLYEATATEYGQKLYTHGDSGIMVRLHSFELLVQPHKSNVHQQARSQLWSTYLPIFKGMSNFTVTYKAVLSWICAAFKEAL